jgi:hypothetical protein
MSIRGSISVHLNNRLTDSISRSFRRRDTSFRYVTVYKTQTAHNPKHRKMLTCRIPNTYAITALGNIAFVGRFPFSNNNIRRKYTDKESRAIKTIIKSSIVGLL